MATVTASDDLGGKIDSMLADIEKNLCQKLPLIDNPYWYAIKNRLLTENGILRGDLENAMRAKIGQPFRIHMLELARAQGVKELYDLVLDVVKDEVFEGDHFELRMKGLRRHGYGDSKLDMMVKPFTRFAINTYRDLAYRSTSTVVPMIGAGMVEKYYAHMCMEIYQAYRDNYNFTHEDVITYYEHATVDIKHADHAFQIAKKYIDNQSLLEEAREGIILAWLATQFLYLGMLQAATDEKQLPDMLLKYTNEFLAKLFEISSTIRIRAQ